jgi:hypothetical protein
MAQFYAELDCMYTKAMLAVRMKDLKPCVDYLILALHWGDAAGLLQPATAQDYSLARYIE